VDLNQLEQQICVAGRIFGPLLSNHDLNCSLLKLVLEYWPTNQLDISDRARKGLQRHVRDAYQSHYGGLLCGSLEPVVRAVVISTIWWWRAHPECRGLFVGRDVPERSSCC
jgi:hypothetical protein